MGNPKDDNNDEQQSTADTMSLSQPADVVEAQQGRQRAARAAAKASKDAAKASKDKDKDRDRSKTDKSERSKKGAQ